MFKPDALFSLDSYKLGHRTMYPEGTEVIYSNFTPRNDKHSPIPDEYNDHKLVWVGLQGTIVELHDLWGDTFFMVDREEVVSQYKKRVKPFTGEEDPYVKHIEDLHDLGHLPIIIKSLPEGAVVPMGVPVFTIVNTDPRFFWLTNYLETHLSAESWHIPTIATIARAYRKVLEKYAEETGSPKTFVDWQAHDFSLRGLSGAIQGAKLGMGHLTSFLGSDNVAAVDWLEYMYEGHKTFVAGSVPASEHSVMCAGGIDGEFETFERILDVYPTGVVSIVADSFDFYTAITEFATKLKPKIMARKPNSLGLCKTVFRPDSCPKGQTPADIICGVPTTDHSFEKTLKDATWEEYVRIVSNIGVSGPNSTGPQGVSSIFLYKDKHYEFSTTLAWRKGGFYSAEDELAVREIQLTPAQKGAVQCLWEIFGGTTTEKGYKVLDEHVGLIYGDSITLGLTDEIMRRLRDKGFASCNVVLGVGSYTYVYNTRDVFGFAMKATYAQVKGEGRAIFKAPKTDPGKNSAKGLLRVEYENGKYVLYDNQTLEQEATGELRVVYDNGEFSGITSLAEIRERIRSQS